MAVNVKRTLAEITAEVSDEFRRQGRMGTPPDAAQTDTDERAFWDEVQRRFDEQLDPAA